jgi:hypothetical protein
MEPKGSTLHLASVSMETYQAWNHALATYFLQGVADGSRIYLSVDDSALDAIAQQQFETEPLNGSWREDLIAAVRRQVVRGDRLELENIQGHTPNSTVPDCVAFLGVLVLAAYDMASDEDISDTNYFRRLRAVLKLGGVDDPRLKGGFARPQGLKAGSTEPLWKRWNRWLREQDMMPSACEGDSRRTKFIHYPISQCLLRQADRDRLDKYFYEQDWTVTWDAQTLFSRLREDTKQFPEYLRQLIKSSGDRYTILSEAIHEVHQQWLEAGCPAPEESGARRSRHPSPNLFAGLYRSEEDYEVEYYLYPKQKPQQKWENVQVNYQGEIKTLESDRPGWYSRLGEPLQPTDLDNGVRREITQPEHLKTLRLPARDFWILVPDPDETDTGVHGTWHSPELGRPFILLCKQALLDDLNRLRDENLVKWSDQYEPFEEVETHWLELHNCQVLSQTWQGVFIENWELKDALNPKVKLAISLSGGLRTPNQKGWLQGHPPSLTVFGFMKTVQIEVLELPDEDRIQHYEAVATSQAHPLEIPHVGSYLIRAIHGNNVAECFVRIMSWDALQLGTPELTEAVILPNARLLCGSVLSEV